MHLPEFDACPMHSAPRALGIGRIKIQCACIGFVLFHFKLKVNANLLTSKSSIVFSTDATYFEWLRSAHKSLSKIMVKR